MHKDTNRNSNGFSAEGYTNLNYRWYQHCGKKKKTKNPAIDQGVIIGLKFKLISLSNPRRYN